MEREASQQKRNAAREKRRRRVRLIRRLKVYGTAAAVLALILYLLSAYALFKIDTIQVLSSNSDEDRASSYYTDEQILAVCGVQIGDSLVRTSYGDTSRLIETALPFIGSVSVQKRFPSTLRLVITDTSAAYAVKDAQSAYILLDESYKVLGESETMPEGCARLIGVQFSQMSAGSGAVFADDSFKGRLETLREAVERAQPGYVTRYDLSNIANVKIVVDGTATVILGTLTELDEKLDTLKRVLESEREGGAQNSIIIDVTDSQRGYVRDDYSPLYEELTAQDVPEETQTNAASPDGEALGVG